MANISSLGSINFGDNPDNLYNFHLPIETVTTGGAVVTKKISLSQVRQYILNSSAAYSTPGLTVGSSDITLCPSNGFVGIGTNNPLTKLHVAGKTYLDGELTVTGFINGTVESAKAANKLTTGRVVTLAGAITADNVTFDGQRNIVLNSALTPDSVTADHIAADAIGTAELQSGAVLSHHIGSEQISHMHVVSASLSGDVLIDSSVDIAKLAPSDTVTAATYTNPTVTINSAGVITAIANSAGIDVSEAYPNQLYVSIGGADDSTNNGSINLPYRTITHALSSATGSSPIAVLVQPGTYVENITITRPNTHIIGLNVATNFSSVEIDGEVAYNIDTSAGDNISTLSNLTLVNNSVSATELLTLSGLAAQSIILSEVGIRDDGVNTSSNNQIVYSNNSDLNLYIDKSYIKSATIHPILWVAAGNATITNSTFVASHAEYGSVFQFDTGTVATIDRCNVTANSKTGIILNGTADVDVTYSTIKGTLSNSTGIDMASGSSLLAVNNIFNVKRGSGFAIKAVEGSVLSHAFNTFLDNQTVLSGVSATALQTVFALVTAAEFTVEVVTPIFDILSVRIKREFFWTQENFIEAPVLSAHSDHTFSATVSTDSLAVTAVNLIHDSGTVYATTSGDTGYQYLTSNSAFADIDDQFSRTNNYTLCADTSTETTLSAVITTVTTTTNDVAVAETSLANVNSDYTISVSNSSLATLSSNDNVPLELRMTISSESEQSLIDVTNYTTLCSSPLSTLVFWPTVVPSNSITTTNSALSAFIGVETSTLTGEAFSAWNVADLLKPTVYRTNTSVTSGNLYVPEPKTGTAVLTLSAHCLSAAVTTNTLTGSWPLSTFQDDQGNYLSLSTYNIGSIMETISSLDGSARVVFDYTDNDGVVHQDIGGTIALTSYNAEVNLNLVYEWGSDLSGTGTMSWNTTAYTPVTQVTVLSTFDLSSAPLTEISYSDAVLLNGLSPLTGDDNDVTFNLLLSSNATSAYNATLPNIQQNTIITPESGVNVITPGVVFTQSVLSDINNTVTIDDLSGLSGTANFVVYTTIITETSAVSSSNVPVTHTFTLSNLGSVGDTRPSIASGETIPPASAIPAGADFALVIDPLSSVTDTGASVSIDITLSGQPVYSGPTIESLTATNATATGQITSISIPSYLLSTANTMLTGLFKTITTLRGGGTLGGIPIEYIEENTLMFNLSVTDPIYIPIYCDFETLIVTVGSDGTGTKFYINGVRQKDVSLGRGKLYMVVLSSPWVSGASDTENAGVHPIDFSSTSNGVHAGGVSLTTGISGTSAAPWNKSNGTAYAQTPGGDGFILLDTSNAALSSLDNIYYYCASHSGMGGKMTFNDECSSATMSGKSAFEVLSTSAPATLSLSAVAEADEVGDDASNQGPEGYVVGIYGSGGKLDVVNDVKNYHRWTYSNELCSLGAPFYMYAGWDNTYTFDMLHDMTDVVQGLVISQVPTGTLRDYIMNGNVLEQASWPLSAFGPALDGTWVTNQSGASGSITLTTNSDLEPYTRGNSNQEPLLVLHTLSGGNNNWIGSTASDTTSGVEGLSASSIIGIFRMRNWATGNYMSYSHDYILNNPGSNVTPGTSY
ncbi:right-handed parallel beta-helix repeat-containing protein [bacterium]|nr:right-handed parallel beta-helix repeat-containing protein [bacterium]